MEGQPVDRITKPDQNQLRDVSPDCDNFLEGFIEEELYAAGRGVSLRTCQRDRQLRQAPPHIIFGRKIYYRIEAVREWLITRERYTDQKPTATRARKLRLSARDNQPPRRDSCDE